MARSVSAIFNEIVAEKNNQPDLNGLTSTSQTAMWRLWAFIVAFAISLHEQLFDAVIEEVKDRLSQGVPGTLPWYAAKAKEFQYNASTSYLLGFDDYNRAVYSVINEADRIIKYASAVESTGGQVIVKVAKDSSGTPAPLTVSELNSFTAYMGMMKFAGTRLQCQSNAADKLKLVLTIYYDPIATLTSVQSEVYAKINSYLTSIPFDGLIYVEKIQDAIQSVASVNSVEITSASADTGSGHIGFPRYYQTYSGYAVIDSAFPLSSTLTFVASNI